MTLPREAYLFGRHETLQLLVEVLDDFNVRRTDRDEHVSTTAEHRTRVMLSFQSTSGQGHGFDGVVQLSTTRMGRFPRRLLAPDVARLIRKR